MSVDEARSPAAWVTLRAYHPAPARVHLAYRPLAGRLFRTLLSLTVFWGAIPLLIWVPPHYPWVVGSFVAGLFLAHRSWTGRFQVDSFAGICPRCGHPVSLGVDHAISLPHTLTCYHCHFEPRLEVSFGTREAPARLEHHTDDCPGIWEPRWLVDEAFLVCTRCNAGAPATREIRAPLDAENERAALLSRLTREGTRLI